MNYMPRVNWTIYVEHLKYAAHSSDIMDTHLNILDPDIRFNLATHSVFQTHTLIIALDPSFRILFFKPEPFSSIFKTILLNLQKPSPQSQETFS